MDEQRKEREGRPIAWLAVLVAIAMLVLVIFMWNRYEARETGDAATGPAAAIRAEAASVPEAA